MSIDLCICIYSCIYIYTHKLLHINMYSYVINLYIYNTFSYIYTHIFTCVCIYAQKSWISLYIFTVCPDFSQPWDAQGQRSAHGWKRTTLLLGS